MSRTRLRGIELAGTRVAVEVPSGLDWAWQGDRYEPFVRSPEGAEVYVGVRVGAAPELPSGAFVYQSATHRFEIAERGDDWLIAVHGPAGLERTAIFDDAFREGEVVLSPRAAEEGISPLAHPLDELMVLHRVTRAGGLVLRASMVLRDDRALVFLGAAQPADPGRRSFRKQAPQRLGGERVVLLPRLGFEGVRAIGCPWTRDPELARPFSARVDAVHSIQTAHAVFADRLDRDSALGELLDHAFAPIHDPRCAEVLFDAAAGLVDELPLLRLGLPEEKRVIPFTWGRSDAAVAFAPPFVG
jgi:hypothetical protein